MKIKFVLKSIKQESEPYSSSDEQKYTLVENILNLFLHWKGSTQIYLFEQNGKEKLIEKMCFIRFRLDMMSICSMN